MTDLGAYIGNNPGDLKRLEGFLGKPVGSLLAFTNEKGDWGDCDPGWMLSGQFLGGTGRRLRWSIPMVPNRYGVGGFQAGARGDHDARWRQWANTCLAHRKNDNDPIYVRTCWELGGEWFGWTGIAKQDPKAFKDCFGRFSKVFKGVSPRFRIVFDFVPDRPDYGVENYYPGDEVVDVIGQDVYWHPQYDGNDPVAAFRRHDTGLPRGLKWTFDFATARGKRIAVPEWAAPGNGNLDGATFIRLMGEAFARYNVEFADYWDGTSAYDGLLSDGGPSATAQAFKKLYVEGVKGIAPAPSPAPAPAPAPTPSPAVEPANPTIGAGAKSLVLLLCQDPHQGDAQYGVKVDGKQVGGTLTAKATRASGKLDTLTVKGDWAPGPHKVEVAFLNDAGGAAGADRNLYLRGARFEGKDLAGVTADLLWTGATHAVSFTVEGGAAPAPTPQPPPAPQPVPAPGKAAEQAKMLRQIADGIEAGTIKVG